MGNTIQHARKRPRQRSLNWRALWWLISREAAFTILHPDRQCRHRFSCVDHIAVRRGDLLVRDISRLLRVHPELGRRP